MPSGLSTGGGIVAALIGVLLISGCATFRSLPAETRAQEITWQSVHAIDAAQTLSVARDPDCYYEAVVDPLIGRHPPQGLVLAWAAGASLLHFAITNYLTGHASPTMVRIWQGITIGSSAYWVSHNYSNGLRVFSHNEHVTGICADRG
jgi:hypothetical protein